MAYIYILKFPNGKAYIGYAKSNVKARWRSHKSGAKRGAPGKLYNAIRKYGFDSIEKTILEEHVDADYTLKILEDRYITLYDSIENGYNSTKGGGDFPVLFGSANPSSKRKGKKMEEFFSPIAVENYKKGRESVKGSKNRHAKLYEITSPLGIKYSVHGELAKFCDEHNLSFGKLYGIASSGGGKIPPISKKANFVKHLEKLTTTVGWTIVDVSENLLNRIVD